MKVKFNLNLSAWIKDVEVEAESMNEAFEKLTKMTIEEMLEEGYCKDFDITDVDNEIVESELTIKVANIDYNITEEDLLEEDEDSISDEEFNIRLNKLLADLPETLTFKLSVAADEDLDDLVADYVADKTGWNNCDYYYEVIDEK